MFRVLISAPYFLPVIERFRKEFESRQIEPVVVPVRERLEESDLLEIIADIDGVICGDDKFTEKVFEKAVKLKVISKWGTGIDSIDREAASRLGIRICNTPNAFTEPVSDSVLGYILAFARRLPWMAADMRSGKWEKIPGITLQECTLGIIGVGNIGRRVAGKASAFNMKILGNDLREIPGDVLSNTGMRQVDLDTLLRESDFISLNPDLNPTSYHLMSEKQFSMVKPNMVMINTSRGPVVDEKSLIDALRTGRIRGAALDVFEIEPLEENSPLREFDQVLMAPHNSNSSPLAWERVHINTMNNLFEGILEGRMSTGNAGDE